MAQVTMTGEEYQLLLSRIEQGKEVIHHLMTERQITITPDNIDKYSSGEFPLTLVFPEWIQDEMCRDMADQLMRLPADTFKKLVNAGHHYYHPKSRELSGWNLEGRTDLLEVSPSLKLRWNTFKKELKEEAAAAADPIPKDNGIQETDQEEET